MLFIKQDMSKYGGIKYKKNFLNQVIIRVDFLGFLETDKLFSDKIEKVICKEFTRRGMEQRINFGMINVVLPSDNSSEPKTQNNSVEGVQREYFDGKNKLVLSNRFLI